MLLISLFLFHIQNNEQKSDALNSTKYSHHFFDSNSKKRFILWMKDVLFYPSVCLPLVTTTKMPPFCFSNVSWRVAVVKEEHQENTFPLTIVLFGIAFDTNGHPQNAHSSMVVMLFGKAIEVKEQSEIFWFLFVSMKIGQKTSKGYSMCLYSKRSKDDCSNFLRKSIVRHFLNND